VNKLVLWAWLSSGALEVWRGNIVQLDPIYKTCLLEGEPLCIPWSSIVEAAAEKLAKQFSVSMVD